MSESVAEPSGSTPSKRGPGAGEERREQILEAALRMFSELGYAKATIKRIAAAAGLRSPALIYFYFPDKAALLRAVIERYAILMRALDAPDPTRIEAAPETFLADLARTALRFFDDPQVERVYRLWMTEWPLFDTLGISIRTAEQNDNAQAFVERYLARQVELGRLRPHDSGAAARSFIAQVWSQAESKRLFPPIYARPIGDREFVESMVSLFLDGLSV